jgi:hypothetical protein
VGEGRKQLRADDRSNPQTLLGIYAVVLHCIAVWFKPTVAGRPCYRDSSCCFRSVDRWIGAGFLTLAASGLDGNRPRKFAAYSCRHTSGAEGAPRRAALFQQHLDMWNMWNIVFRILVAHSNKSEALVEFL